MTRKLQAMIGVSALLLSVLLVINPVTHAAVPSTISYQGRLTGPTGNPLQGTFSVRFTIYTSLVSSTSKWQETQSITTESDGSFAVLLGAVAPLTDSVFQACNPALAIKVGLDPEISPRTMLTSVPFSFIVSTIDGAKGGAIGSKLTIGWSNTNTGADAFVAGIQNVASGDYTTIAGGNSNHATAEYASVGGGAGDSAGGVYSVVGGGSGNKAAGGYATISGGYYCYAGDFSSVIAGGIRDSATGYAAFIGSGSYNVAGDTSATVPGGSHNRALGAYAAIGGGSYNVASGYASTVPGGERDSASGKYSFAAGHNANAKHAGAFVLADSTASLFSSTAVNQFSVRASGGTRIYSNAGLTAGVILNAGASAWSVVSDSSLKENIRPVDGAEILEKLASMPVSRWSYKAQDASIEHVGPMAQDFYSAFSLGEDNTHINTIDPDGIALAAIQELYKQNKDLAEKNEALKSRLDDLQRKIESMLSSQK